jgi:hypothetical protein
MRVLVMALVVVLGCRKSTADAPDTAPKPATEAPPLVTAGDPFAPPATIELPQGELPPPLVETVTEDAGNAPGKAAPADPFASTITSVQQSAVGCFAGLPPGDYAATIEVVVTAAGTATRTSVTSGPADAAIRKCLESAAQRGYPSSPNGRKLSIDVRVKG